MTEEQIKEYLQKYNITSQELLAKHIEQLKKNTKPNIALISELFYVLEDENSFLRGKTINQHISQAIQSPMYIDEVLEQKEEEIFKNWNSNSTRHKSRSGETHDKYISKVLTQEHSRLENLTVDNGIKETDGKLYYELSWEFIEEMAKRMANNKSDKYPLYNWKKEISIEDLKQAINRHHIEVMKGNYKDGDEILGHIISYACNSMMLWEQLNK